MKQRGDIKRFIETVLDSSITPDQQSKICSTELSLIGSSSDGVDPPTNGYCQNSSDSCGRTNKFICYNSGNFCNLSSNPGKCVNTEPVYPPANPTCDPPIVDNQM